MLMAVIPYSSGFEIDRFMADAASRLKARGLRLGGVVQHNEGTCESGCFAMALEDLASGARFPISENRVDATGLAAAGGALGAALADKTDLVIVNKFGRQEALGKGLRHEIAAALLAGLPVLIAVRRDMLPAFRDFAGEDWTELPALAEAVESWGLGVARVAA